MKKTKWITGKYDENIAKHLEDVLNVPSLTAKLLAVRGIKKEDEARFFLKKDTADLHDPFLLKDMDLAVARITQALSDGETIAVYGDYDADGVTSTYILTDYLISCGAKCVHYIPDRFGDGYGISETGLSYLLEKGVSLIVTVDTGITAGAEVEYAKELGMDIVVTDHHKCAETLPAAVAVVNPNREDCTYPFRPLAGVGVAFKLICALSGSDEEVIKKYLPYVCIGTIADVMPITDENRVIVANGLELISENPDPGLSALMDVAGFKRSEKLTSGAVGFLIGPRMNAAGRMGSADIALSLLRADEEDAPSIAKEIDEKNRERQLCESGIMKEALAVMEEHPEYKDDSIIILSGKGWHHGVLGIVASRICSLFSRPAILISEDEEGCRGSGRSVSGVSLHNALSACSDLLEKFGGHDLAAGILIKKENIAEFRRRMNEALAPEMESYVPELEIDFKADYSELTLSQLHALRAMEPYGKENEAPKLRLDSCKVSKISPIGNGRHTKIAIEHGVRLQCVYFGIKCEELPFAEGDYIDMVFTPEINNYMGENVQLHIKDARPTEDDLADIDGAYECLDNARKGVRDEKISLAYDELGGIWKALTRQGFPTSAPITEVRRLICRNATSGALKKLFVAMQIFSEVGLMSFEISDYRIFIEIANHNNKVDLNDSKTYLLYKNSGGR